MAISAVPYLAPPSNAVEHAVPVSMPRLPGASGFDITLWVGWERSAALDAFTVRAGLTQSQCSSYKRWDCISRRFARNTQGNEGQSLNEFEDLRHLYAHNYAGEADAKYFKHKRHVFVSYVTTPLTCGAIRWPPTVARSAPPSEVRQHSTECTGTLSVNVVAAPYATNSQCRIKPPFWKDPILSGVQHSWRST